MQFAQAAHGALGSHLGISHCVRTDDPDRQAPAGGVDLHGTPFQKRVWQALNEIPAGKTYSYAEIARQIGAASAVRAVGSAIGRNPVSVIVPCHRVVGSNGKLTGYAGGLDRKAWLLAHEARIIN